MVILHQRLLTQSLFPETLSACKSREPPADMTGAPENYVARDLGTFLAWLRNQSLLRVHENMLVFSLISYIYSITSIKDYETSSWIDCEREYVRAYASGPDAVHWCLTIVSFFFLFFRDLTFILFPSRSLQATSSRLAVRGEWGQVATYQTEFSALCVRGWNFLLLPTSWISVQWKR